MNILALLIYLALAALPLRAATYYVDSRDGADSRTGLSSGEAWKSLDAANAHRFAVGDRLLFKAGTSYQGRLSVSEVSISAHETADAITIDMYGVGPLPRIDAGGKFPEAVLIQNVDRVRVGNLEVTNHGPEPAAWRAGVRVVVDWAGAMRDVRLHDLYVHDVNGDLRKREEGCGIYLEAKGNTLAHFENLVVERCHVVRTDRNGICQRAMGGTHSIGVVIRENLLEDIGGDGIKAWGSEGPVIERNVLRGGRMRCKDAAAGMWPWDCNNAVIQYNEVCGMKGTLDGQAFDADYMCRGTLIQYNYSHDNQGGFLLVCTPASSYCDGTVVRYNVSQNDGVDWARVIQIGGGPRNTRIYNNTIYVGPKQNLPMVSFNEWGGAWASDTSFTNNLFYVDGAVSYEEGSSVGTLFEHNYLYGDNGRKIPGFHVISAKLKDYRLMPRPALVKPGSGANGFDSLAGYRWEKGAEHPRGALIPGNGGRDLFGAPVSSKVDPAVGAAQGE